MANGWLVVKVDGSTTPSTLAEGLRYLVIKGKTQRNEEATAEFCQIATWGTCFYAIASIAAPDMETGAWKNITPYCYGEIFDRI